MSVIGISLDTSSRQMALTIDGVIVPATDLFVEKYRHDGEDRISFSYTTESVNMNGLKERRQFYLPSREEIAIDAHAGFTLLCYDKKVGLASKIVHDDEKAKADTIEFIQKQTLRRK